MGDSQPNFFENFDFGASQPLELNTLAAPMDKPPTTLEHSREIVFVLGMLKEQARSVRSMDAKLNNMLSLFSELMKMLRDNNEQINLLRTSDSSNTERTTDVVSLVKVLVETLKLDMQTVIESLQHLEGNKNKKLETDRIRRKRERQVKEDEQVTIKKRLTSS